MSRGLLVCFVGIDGSGKTTVCRRAEQELVPPNGRPFQYLWFRSKLQLKLSALLEGRRRAAGRATLGANKPWQPRQRTLVTRLYNVVVWLDYVFLVGLRTRWRLSRGENLLCDRYAHDIAVDLAADFDHSEVALQRGLGNVQRFFPRPDLILFFDVPEEVSLSRKDDVPSKSFLTARRRGYRVLAAIPGVLSIDGTQPREEVYATVIAELTKLGVQPRHIEVTS